MRSSLPEEARNHASEHYHQYTMENKFQNELAQVRNRVQDLKDARKAENSNAGAMGMNAFIYDQLLAINEDLISLYQNLNQTQEFAKGLPAATVDAQLRRPSGR